MLMSTTSSYPSLHLHHHNHRLRSRTNIHCQISLESRTAPQYYYYEYNNNNPILLISPKKRGRIGRSETWVLKSNPTSTKNQTVVVTAPTTKSISESDEFCCIDSASNVVRKFYGGINSHDLASVEDLIADNCVYEDLVFPRPFVGRKAILDFFKKFIDSISTDLQFVIDDISDGDTTAVGVTWHLEWKGKPFPFSKGCSFYRLEVVNDQRKIIYGRDIVEPARKPGDMALVAIRGVTWLLQQFPQLANRL